MKEESLEVRDVIALLLRNFWVVALTTIICLSIAVSISFVLPKSFKSRSILNIQASYFQNPLINDLITDVHDPGEIRAQRSSLLRLALDEQYVDSLAMKYGVYQSKRNDATRALERELFMERIQYYSLSPTTFQISVIANDPALSQKMTGEVLKQMMTTLVDTRADSLQKTRNSIQAHVEALGKALRDSAGPAASKHPEALRGELERVKANIETLLLRFTELHPEIVKLRKQEKSISDSLELAGNIPNTKPSLSFVNPQAKEPTQDVYNDLLRKLSYLNIVLDMEADRDSVSYLGIIEQPTLPTKAFFPNKKLFAMLGLGVGILLSAMFVIFLELRRRLYVTPEQASDLLEIPYLGELPALPETQQANKLLSASRTFSINRQLPAG